MSTEATLAVPPVVRVYDIDEDGATGRLLGQATLVHPQVALLHPPLSTRLTEVSADPQQPLGRARVEVVTPGTVEVRDADLLVSEVVDGIRAAAAALDVDVAAVPLELGAELDGPTLQAIVSEGVRREVPTPPNHQRPSTPDTLSGSVRALPPSIELASRVVSPLCRWFRRLPFC